MENDLITTIDKISESLKRLDLSTKSIVHFTEELFRLNESCASLSSTTAKLDSNDIFSFFSAFDNVMEPINSILKLENTIVGLTSLRNRFKELADKISFFVKQTEMGTTIACAATGIFSSSLPFLVANPIEAVIGGLTLLFGVVTVLSNSFGR